VLYYNGSNDIDIIEPNRRGGIYMDKKRMAAIAMAVATLGSLAVTPANATVIKDSDTVNQSRLEWYEANATTEAIIYLNNADENTGTYYLKSPVREPSIDLSSLSEEDMDTVTYSPAYATLRGGGF
jgi:hypothetical protein